MRITSGRLAQRVLERDLPAFAVDADLALRDDAVAVLVHELDRILDRDDVAVAVLVAVPSSDAMDVDLPAPVAPMNIMMPRLLMMMSFSTGGSPSSSNLGMSIVIVRSTMPTRPCWTNAVDAKAADARRADREVALLGAFELRGLLVVHDAAHELDRVLGRQLRLADRRDLAVDLDGRREARP
jgi:hypothetical protein